MFSLLFFSFLSLIITASSLDCSAQSCNSCTQIPGCNWCPSTTSCIPSSSDCQSIKLSNAYNCPVNSTIVYDDNYVRNTVYPLIGATKGSTPNEIMDCAQKTARDIIHWRRINVTCNSDVEFCVVDLYIIPSLSTIAIISHGSDGKAQIMHELKDMLDSNDTTKAEKLQGLFLFAGHSLGGSLSSLFATEMVLSGIVPSNQIQLITFGMPRTGDLEFAESVEKNLPYHFRVINGDDVIPTLPPLNITNPLALQHFRFEVFYPSGMVPFSQFKVCPINEDPSCRNSLESFEKQKHLKGRSHSRKRFYESSVSFVITISLRFQNFMQK